MVRSRGSEGAAETPDPATTAQTAQLPRSARGQSAGAVPGKGEASPVRQASGLGGSPALPRPALPNPTLVVRPPPPPQPQRQPTGDGRLARSSGVGASPSTSPFSGGPGRTPQTRRKELTLQPGQSDPRYGSPGGSPRARGSPAPAAGTPGTLTEAALSRPDPT